MKQVELAWRRRPGGSARKRVAAGKQPQRTRLARAWLATVGVVSLVLLAGCSNDGRPLTTLDPQGQASRDIHTLVKPVFIIAGVVFLFVNLGVVYVALRFRRSNDGADEFPEQVHGNRALELGWTILPGIILFGVAIFTLVTLFKLSNEPDDASKDFDVTVVGHQWWWSYEYDLGRDGTVDFTTANEMIIPVGVPVHLDITSRDVIHSFWIPALNGKKDAAPGRVHPLWMEADHAGRYLGQCTEFCGLSHAYMRMLVEAKEPGEFASWVEEQMEEAAIPAANDAAARRGLETFVSQCTTCHVVKGVNGPDCEAIKEEDEYKADESCWVGAAPFVGAAQMAGEAPDLTHLMSRYLFVGGLYDLRDPDTGDLNRNNLERWIRNPVDLKPMAPTPSGGNKFGRGMPTLPLTEDQIDDLVAYLSTLK